MGDILDFTYSLVRQNSGSSNLEGVAQVQRQLAERIQQIGLQPQWLASALTGGAQTLSATFNPDATHRLLLMGHADTVFALDSGFDAITSLSPNRINAPGIADMKGGLAVMLEALKQSLPHFEHAGIGIDILVNGDEETGSLGSRLSIEQKAKGAQAAFAYEPALADGSMAGARAASANMSFHFEGLSAHAGRAFFDGRNAVVALARCVLAFEEIWKSHEGVTINSAVINGGQALNAIPDSASLQANARAKKQSLLQTAIDEIEAACRRVESDTGVKITRTGGIHRPAKEATTAQAQLEACVADHGQSLGLELPFVDTLGVCDGNIIAHAGTPVVDTMGVRGGLIHTADEFVELDSFIERVELSKRVFHSIDSQFLEGLNHDR